MAEIAFAFGILLTFLNILDRLKGFRRRQDRQADALERVGPVLEAQHAALERIAVAVEQLPH